jgi:hypothetical protein
MSDDEGPPAPPCRFRCNRSRMVLTIQITLHHVGADHINLETSKNTIKLDTLKSRRKFKMCRAYPRGIECDDSKTTAKLEGGLLNVEMPITKLPTPADELKKQAEAKASAKAAANAKAAAGKAGKNNKKRKGDDDAQAPAKKRKQGAAAAQDSDEDFEAGRGMDSDDEEAQGSSRSGKKQKQQQAVELGRPAPKQKGAKAAPASDARMAELMEEAVSGAAQKREQGLQAMRKLQQRDADAEAKSEAKAAERKAAKQQLLDTFKKQQAAQKAAKKADKAQREELESRREAKAKDGSKKRVSFG